VEQVLQHRQEQQLKKVQMKEMKALLAKHNALERFGIILLHDHFPIAEDEEMVELQDSKN